MSNRVSGLPDPARVPAEHDEDAASPSNAEPSALRGAISSRDINVVEHDLRADAYGYVPTLHERAAREQALRDHAVRTVLEATEKWMVDSEDVHRGLIALNTLKPEEFNQALRTLQDEGELDDFVENLSPRDLMVFTRRLTEAGIFKWVPAQDANGQSLPGAPHVIQVKGFDPPEELRALAHDINIAVAKRTPDRALYEPETGVKLEPSSFHLFNWRGDLTGKVESMLSRYHALLDVETAVHELRPGDRYEISAEVGGAFNLGKKLAGADLAGELKVGGKIDVARSDKGDFTVGAESSVIRGIAAELGLDSSGKLSASLGGGRSTRVEWTFKNADDAARVARLLGQLGTPQGAQELIADPKARSLLKQVSAVELGPDAVASLGLTSASKKVFGLEKAVELGAEASLSQRLKVELEGGRPKAVVLSSALELESSAGVTKGDYSVSFGSSKLGGAHARLEQRVEWRPGASMGEVARAALESRASLEVGVEATRGLAALKGANEVTFKATGEPARLLSGAVALGRGDVGHAFDGIEGELTSSRIHTTTLSGGASLDLGKAEVGATLSSKRTHVLQTDTVKGSGSVLAERLAHLLAPAAKPGDMEPLDRGLL